MKMKYFLKPPSPGKVEKILEEHRLSPFSYPDVGLTLGSATTAKNEPIKNYQLDTYRVSLGKGDDNFKKAKKHFENWEMFSLDWIHLYPRKQAIKEGVMVGVLAKVLGIWVLNLCRIVHTVYEERVISFSYGTLDSHAEKGEEKFSVLWSEENDEVYYEITAFSRPNLWMAKLGYPYVRMLQKRFGRDSLEKMRELTVGGGGF